MRKISPRLIYFFGALGGLLFGYDTGLSQVPFSTRNVPLA